MAISKRSIAREWLILVVILSMGLPLSLGWYYHEFKNAKPRFNPYRSFVVEGKEYKNLAEYEDLNHIARTPPEEIMRADPAWFVRFWNDLIKYPRFKTVAPWFAYPYLAVTLLRSIWWSIRVLLSRDVRLSAMPPIL